MATHSTLYAVCSLCLISPILRGYRIAFKGDGLEGGKFRRSGDISNRGFYPVKLT